MSCTLLFEHVFHLCYSGPSYTNCWLIHLFTGPRNTNFLHRAYTRCVITAILMQCRVHPCINEQKPRFQISSDNIKNPTHTWLTSTTSASTSKPQRPLSGYPIISDPDAYLGSVFPRTRPSMRYNPKIGHRHYVPSPFCRPELSFTSSIQVGSIQKSSELLQCLLLLQKMHPPQEIWKRTVSKVQRFCYCTHIHLFNHATRRPESNRTILQCSP